MIKVSKEFFPDKIESKNYIVSEYGREKVEFIWHDVIHVFWRNSKSD